MRMKNTIRAGMPFLVLFLLFTISYAETSFNFLTIGQGDYRYCKQGGPCNISNATFITTANINATGIINAPGFKINNTFIQELFINDNTVNSQIYSEDFDVLGLGALYYPKLTALDSSGDSNLMIDERLLIRKSGANYPSVLFTTIYDTVLGQDSAQIYYNTVADKLVFSDAVEYDFDGDVIISGSLEAENYNITSADSYIEFRDSVIDFNETRIADDYYNKTQIDNNNNTIKQYIYLNHSQAGYTTNNTDLKAKNINATNGNFSGKVCDSVGCIGDGGAGSGGNPFDQWINTTSDVRFNNVTIDNRLIVNSTTYTYVCPTPTGSFTVTALEDPGGGYEVEGAEYSFFVYGKCSYQGRDFYSSGYVSVEDWSDLDQGLDPFTWYYRQFNLAGVNKNGVPELRVLYARGSSKIVDRGYDLTGTSFNDYEDINPWSTDIADYTVNPKNATTSNITNIIRGGLNLTGTLNLHSELDWFSFITQNKKIFSARPWFNMNLNAYESEFFAESNSSVLFSSDQGQLRLFHDNRVVGSPIERTYIETNRDHLIFSDLNYNIIPEIAFNAEDTKIHYNLVLTPNSAQGCGGVTQAGRMYYNYVSGVDVVEFCDGTDWRRFVLTGYGGNIIIPKTKKLYFSDNKNSYNSSIYWDGVNLVFKTNLTQPTGDAWFSRNVSATGFIVRSSVYDLSRGDALDNIKDASLLSNPDGSVNHSASFCYVTYPVIDYNNYTIIKTETLNYCFYFKIDNITRCVPDNRSDWNEAPDIIYKGTNISINKEIKYGTKLEEGEDLECSADLAIQGLAEYLKAIKPISISENKTGADTTVLFAEEIYTKSRVPEPDVNYCKMIQDADIYDKSNHYAYKLVGDRYVLDAEYRWVVLEGCEKQKLNELCVLGNYKYSWCPPKP